MFITKKHLSRRTFLMGTFGATVALPFLDAMVPALTAQARTAANRPLRFAAMYIPNGIFPESGTRHDRVRLRAQARDGARSRDEG
jgi:hypothetical protein